MGGREKLRAQIKEQELLVDDRKKNHAFWEWVAGLSNAEKLNELGAARDEMKQAQEKLTAMRMALEYLPQEATNNGAGEEERFIEEQEDEPWTPPPVPEGKQDLYRGKRSITGEPKRWLLEKLQSRILEERGPISFEDLWLYVDEELKVHLRGSRTAKPRRELSNILTIGSRRGFFERLPNAQWVVGPIEVPSRQDFAAKWGGSWAAWARDHGLPET